MAPLIEVIALNHSGTRWASKIFDALPSPLPAAVVNAACSFETLELEHSR